MNAFENLGYAASNELAPDAWKDYMLGNLDKQDQYQQERLNQYVALQERARAKRIRQNQIAGIKSALGSVGQIAGQFGAGAETPLGTTGALTTASGATITPSPALPDFTQEEADILGMNKSYKKQPSWMSIWENQ
jgi:hypothetical protein